MNVNKDGFTLRVVTSLSLPSKARLLIHEIPRLQPSSVFRAFTLSRSLKTFLKGVVFGGRKPVVRDLGLCVKGTY